MTQKLHPDTIKLVQDLSVALYDKLLKAQEKYGYSNGWLTDEWQEDCREQFDEHVSKGDPLDVIAYAAFMWKRGWEI